jgi:hypothetical protein
MLTVSTLPTAGSVTVRGGALSTFSCPKQQFRDLKEALQQQHIRHSAIAIFFRSLSLEEAAF